MAALQKVVYMLRSTSSRRVASDFLFFAMVGGNFFFLFYLLLVVFLLRVNVNRRIDRQIVEVMLICYGKVLRMGKETDEGRDGVKGKLE